MLVALPPPYLSLIPVLNSQETIEDGIHGEQVVGEFEQDNRAKLEELRRQRELLTIFSYAVGLGGIAGTALFSPALIIPYIPSQSLLLGELQRVSQRFLLMSQLVDAFEDESIAIEVGLKPEGLREIDFFLRFPDKEFILIQIRSMGNAKIGFSEQHGALRFRKQGGGYKTWNPDPLQELIEQERWLRRERPDLLGGSSRDKRRPIAKVLVLAAETTVAQDQPEHLYTTIDGVRYLTIRNSGTTSVVTKDEAVNFLGAYLSSKRSRKASQNG